MLGGERPSHRDSADRPQGPLTVPAVHGHLAQHREADEDIVDKAKPVLHDVDHGIGEDADEEALEEPSQAVQPQKRQHQQRRQRELAPCEADGARSAPLQERPSYVCPRCGQSYEGVPDITQSTTTSRSGNEEVSQVEPRNWASDRVETNSGLLSLLCDVKAVWVTWPGRVCALGTQLHSFWVPDMHSHLKMVGKSSRVTSEPGPLVGCLRSGGHVTQECTEAERGMKMEWEELCISFHTTEKKKPKK